MRASTSRRIVFTAYDGVSLLDLSGPLEAFRVAADFALKEQRTTYECIVLSARGGRVKTANGVELNTKSARSISGKAIDTLLVPGAFRVEDDFKPNLTPCENRRSSGSCIVETVRLPTGLFFSN